MSPRTGRPTNDPKVLIERARLSEEDAAMLEYCCKHTGKNKSEIIRMGIRKVYEGIKNSSKASPVKVVALLQTPEVILAGKSIIPAGRASFNLKRITSHFSKMRNEK